MKAITILQPWASLIVWGEKQFETGNWQSKHRGPIAIQAGRRFSDSARALCAVEPFNSVLRAHGVNFYTELPLGAILKPVARTAAPCPRCGRTCRRVNEIASKTRSACTFTSIAGYS